MSDTQPTPPAPQPPEDWIKKMAEAEDKCESVAAGYTPKYEHTPEPWVADGRSVVCYGEVAGGEFVRPADCARAVACVNACAGLDPAEVGRLAAENERLMKALADAEEALAPFYLFASVYDVPGTNPMTSVLRIGNQGLMIGCFLYAREVFDKHFAIAPDGAADAAGDEGNSEQTMPGGKTPYQLVRIPGHHRDAAGDEGNSEQTMPGGKTPYQLVRIPGHHRDAAGGEG